MAVSNARHKPYGSGWEDYKANNIGFTEVLNMAKDVRETLVEFQAQVVQALRKL